MVALALAITLGVLGIPVLAFAGYLFVLAILAAAPDEDPALELDPGPPRLRFDIVVPAHDEEAGIAATIASLRELDYPAPLFRVLVVADNCGDATAERAAAAGAEVLVRNDPAHRGKGHALAHAFAWIEQSSASDAVVVVDADSSVSPGFLRAFARRFEAGAPAVQAAYGVRNPEASWRTRLMVIALALFHVLRSLGRERLGLSTGLRGNGMALTRAVLRNVPYDAFSIVEDVEYSLALGEAGYRVHYAAEAQVLGEMTARATSSRSQRRRWEQGRWALARTRGPRLVLAGIRRRSPLLIDLAVDLLLPPLTSLTLLVLAGLAAALALHARGGSLAPAVPWILAAGCLAVYVLRGWALSGAGLRGLVDLLVGAPAYVIWKIGLGLARRERRGDEWVRTEREVRHDSRSDP
jgi:cellulose synthase/poly-beta-1,6-N-acetylglucosamine synthase-like glycosyltransferase